MSRWPNHRNSRSGRTERTLGLKRMPDLPGGAMLTESRAPFARFPEMDLMNGFQVGISAKFVNSAHTRFGGASISRLVSMQRCTMCSSCFLPSIQSTRGPERDSPSSPPLETLLTRSKANIAHNNAREIVTVLLFHLALRRQSALRPLLI